MEKYRVRNHTFDRWGEKFHPLIDRDHFLGRSSLDIPWSNKSPNKENAIPVNEKDFTLEISTPGYLMEELTVKYDGGVLYVKGEKRRSNEHPDTDSVLEEHSLAIFERWFRLSPKVTSDKMEANYKKDLLQICFYHSTEDQADYRNIEVEPASK